MQINKYYVAGHVHSTGSRIASIFPEHVDRVLPSKLRTHWRQGEAVKTQKLDRRTIPYIKY